MKDYIVDDHEIKKLQNELIKVRLEIEHLSLITKLERKPVQLAQTAIGRLTRMDAMQVQAIQIETARRRELEIKRINVALDRIEKGDFGLCKSCGFEIAPKRLKNDPTVTTCVECATKV